MATSPNLGIALLAATDSNKYAEMNSALTTFDAVYAGNVEVNWTFSTGWAMASVFLLAFLFIFPAIVGYGSAGATVTLPDNARLFLVRNLTGAPLTFMVGSGSQEVTIPYNDTECHLLYSDGSAKVSQVS